MRIAILSRKKNLYSTRRLQEAAALRGHEVEIVDYLNCYMNIGKNPAIHYRGQLIAPFDAIIPRIGARRTFYGTAIVRQFETMGTYSVNPSIAITRSRDKLRSLQLLGMKGINMPVTGIAHSASDMDDLLKMVGGAPTVLKLIEGTQGVGVVLAETKEAAQSMVQAFIDLNANIILQEYIREAKGGDIRCFVVGDKVIAAIKRQAKPGEFRANLHQGGTACAYLPTIEETALAVKAAKIMGLSVAGVDILPSDRGPLVLEVNSSPGLEGIETATKQDVAVQIIQFIEFHAKNKHLKKDDYQG